MPWPPTAPPNDRLNTTPTVDNHPSDHNLLADAITDIANLLGTDPAGIYTDIQDRLDAIEFELRPPGELMHDAGGTAPPGRWLATNGAEYPRVAPYDRLFNRIGVVWGAGNGATTFNVPNLAGRTLFAVGGGTVTATLGRQNYGSKDAVVVSHAHTMKNHVHAIPHAHGMKNHVHGLSTGGTDLRGGHLHGWGQNGGFFFNQSGGNWQAGVTGGGSEYVLYAFGGSDNGEHGHALTGNSAGPNDNTTDGTDTPNSAGPNDNTSDPFGVPKEDANMPPGANCTIWIRY